MIAKIAWLLVIGIILLWAPTDAQAQTASGPQFSAGFVAGYKDGTGFSLYGRVDRFAQDFPLSLKIGLGYASVEPGSATEARSIFINDATNGIPEESGRVWDFRLDFMYPIEVAGLRRAYVLGGPRYTRFVGNFKYIGGNEDFDVKSNQWGFGLGAESYFAISRTFDLVLSGGYEYFPTARLSGHDTSYSPDNDNVNSRNDYTFDDADNAINQPRHRILFMLGLSYTFGL